MAKYSYEEIREVAIAMSRDGRDPDGAYRYYKADTVEVTYSIAGKDVRNALDEQGGPLIAVPADTRDEIREWQEKCERLEVALRTNKHVREALALERNAWMNASIDANRKIEDLQRQLEEQVKRRMEEENVLPSWVTPATRLRGERYDLVATDEAMSVPPAHQHSDWFTTHPCEGFPRSEHGPSAVEKAPTYRPGVTVYCQGEEDGDV